LGGSFNADDVDHFVGSVGRDLAPGGNLLTAYFAYQWTFPGE
jgi:hypothetical protein